MAKIKSSSMLSRQSFRECTGRRSTEEKFDTRKLLLHLLRNRQKLNEFELNLFLLIDIGQRLALLYPLSIHVSYRKGFREAKACFFDFVKSAFEKRKLEDPNINSGRRLDFLDMLMKSSDTTEHEKLVMSNLGLFIIAGHDS